MTWLLTWHSLMLRGADVALTWCWLGRLQPWFGEGGEWGEWRPLSGEAAGECGFVRRPFGLPKIPLCSSWHQESVGVVKTPNGGVWKIRILRVETLCFQETLPTLNSSSDTTCWVSRTHLNTKMNKNWEKKFTLFLWIEFTRELFSIQKTLKISQALWLFSLSLDTHTSTEYIYKRWVMSIYRIGAAENCQSLATKLWWLMTLSSYLPCYHCWHYSWSGWHG